MENLYDILQVDEKSKDIEIKKAYIKMLRKYPPEKYTEEFKKIREAYEILIDPVLKLEYNAFINYKDDIEEYREKGNSALSKHQYKRAILYYKKILLIEPRLTFAKNKLGLAFFYNKQYEEAIIQFRELIRLNPNNAIFYNNLAYVYKEMKKYDIAEELLLKSYSIDNTNEKTVLVLGNIYTEVNDCEKGIEFTQKCLEDKNLDSLNKMIYCVQLIEMYIVMDNLKMINETMNIIKNIIADEYKVKKYIVWKLQNICKKLLQDNKYILGKNMCIKLLEIDSDNKKIRELLLKFDEILKVLDLLKQLQKDDSIIDCLKKPIIDYLHFDVDNEKEFNKEKRKNLESIRECIDKNSLQVIKNIDMLSDKYAKLYKYKESLYKDAYNMAKENNTQIKKQNNSKVCLCKEEDYPKIYDINRSNKKKFVINKKYLKIIVSCIFVCTLLGIIYLKM